MILALLMVASSGATATSSPRSVISELTRKPERVGQCFVTHVQGVGYRLFDEGKQTGVAGTGSKITFADGHENVGYDQVAAIDASKAKDPVRLCVRSLPVTCPAGDARGIVYRARNLRSGLSWESSDSAHPCDGA